MPFEFIDFNSPPMVAVNCDNQKAMVKEQWHRKRYEKLTKMITQSWEKKTMSKRKSNFKIIRVRM